MELTWGTLKPGLEERQCLGLGGSSTLITRDDVCAAPQTRPNVGTGSKW